MKRLMKGFTLFEILLVLAIATSIFGILLTYTTQRSDQLRRDRAVIQYQQILNAALSYYTQNGKWPGTTAWTMVDKDHDLITSKFLPPGTGTNNSWMGYDNTLPYYTVYDGPATSTHTNNFYVISGIPPGTRANAIGGIIASQLPSGATQTGLFMPSQPGPCGASGACYVITDVAPPGQNLANARSVNFGSLYHNGACVPVPSCPTGMQPTIFVVPADVKGVYDQPTCPDGNPANCTNVPVYPISSYTAYAKGTGQGSGPQPAACGTSTAAACYSSNGGGTITSGDYWRVCLQIVTSKGVVIPTTNVWGQLAGSILAITRCMPTNEPEGSDFTVWSN